MSILLPLKPFPGIPEPVWLTAPESPGLAVNELHIWRARLEETPGSGGASLPCPLSGDRGQRLNNHKERKGLDCPVARDRGQKLKAALFRKAILERYTAPGLPDVLSGPASGIRIAVAQCEHLALIAVSRDVRRIGLDVERVRQDIPIEEMAGGFLDARSQWTLRVTWCLQEKAWKFFQFWTSNEACEQAGPCSQSAHACQVRDFSPEADFIAALAIQGGVEAEVRYWDWSGE